jgi:NAD(P)-dependent dehydrogenase (short-subunit alcohol dehydrogenase family)
MGETVLITGCSSGIGRATAEAFLADGWDVYATSRNATKLDALAEQGAETVKLDVTDDGDVRTVVSRVREESGGVDVLVSNAGYGQFGPLEDVSTEEVIDQFDVNTFGPHRLARAVLPGMRERGRGRIVNVTGGANRLSLPGIGAYVASKLALESMSDALRAELADAGVEVVVVEPGVVATDFYNRVLADLPADRTPAYADLYSVLDDVGVVERGPPGVNAPEDVAQVIREAATAPRPDARYRVGAFATVGTAAGTVVTGRLRDRLARLGISLLSREPVQRLLRQYGEEPPPADEPQADRPTADGSRTERRDERPDERREERQPPDDG